MYIYSFIVWYLDWMRCERVVWGREGGKIQLNGGLKVLCTGFSR